MTAEQGEDILGTAAAWRDSGAEVGLATVIATWGSSPRPVGSQLVVDGEGRFTFVNRNAALAIIPVVASPEAAATARRIIAFAIIPSRCVGPAAMAEGAALGRPFPFHMARSMTILQTYGQVIPRK